MSKTLFEKIWQRNLVREETKSQPAMLYVSLHLLHEITSPQAFQMIERKGLGVRRPELTLAMVDHCAPSKKDHLGDYDFPLPSAKDQIKAMESYCDSHGIRCLDLKAEQQGIVHVVAPELGFSRPGSVIVCGDSHTSTHGAFGAIAMGIGTSEVAQVLATQCIMLRKPKNLRVVVNGQLPSGTSAKDLAISIISQLGANSCAGFAVEYQGETISALSMEERLTLCNMTIEAGSRFGLVAPDEKTKDYLLRTPFGGDLDYSSYEDLYSDEGANWDRTITIDATTLSPMITWGTTPAMAVPLSKKALPDPKDAHETRAFEYMGWESSSFHQRAVDHVFIGSCTNGRLSDLKAAAQVLSGRKIAAHTECLIVPGSKSVKREAERLGLAQIFTAAGARWGEPGCSLCNAMNGDYIPEKKLVVSTSNRNFEGRQGINARTILASPKTAAEIACRGEI